MPPRKPDRKRRWASLPTAAEYFDCTVETIRNYIAAGYLPGHRVPNGRTIKVDLNELDDMVLPIPSAQLGRSA